MRNYIPVQPEGVQEGREALHDDEDGHRQGGPGPEYEVQGDDSRVGLLAKEGKTQ